MRWTIEPRSDNDVSTLDYKLQASIDNKIITIQSNLLMYRKGNVDMGDRFGGNGSGGSLCHVRERSDPASTLREEYWALLAERANWENEMMVLKGRVKMEDGISMGRQARGRFFSGEVELGGKQLHE